MIFIDTAFSRTFRADQFSFWGSLSFLSPLLRNRCFKFQNGNNSVTGQKRERSSKWKFVGSKSSREGGVDKNHQSFIYTKIGGVPSVRGPLNLYLIQWKCYRGAWRLYEYRCLPSNLWTVEVKVKSSSEKWKWKVKVKSESEKWKMKVKSESEGYQKVSSWQVGTFIHTSVTPLCNTFIV